MSGDLGIQNSVPRKRGPLLTSLLRTPMSNATSPRTLPSRVGSNATAATADPDEYSTTKTVMEENLGGIEKFNRLSTWLANERTWLAWVRTAVSLIGFGIVILKLDDDVITQILGCILSSFGILCFFIGSLRYDIMRTVIDTPGPVTDAYADGTFGRPGLRKFGWPLFFLMLGSMAYYVVKTQ